MVSLLSVLTLVGAAGFLAAAALAARLYVERPLFRNYWFSWVVATGHLALWALADLLGRLGVVPFLADSVVPLLLLTVGLGALLHIALYDNTGSEGLLTEIRTSEALNEAVVDNYPDGAVVLFDADLTVLRAGGDDLPARDGAVADAEGTSLPALLPEPVLSRVEPPCRAALDGESASFDLSHDRATYEARALPLAGDPRTDGGSPTRHATVDDSLALLVVRNVTDRERRERRLREQRDRLSTLDRISRVLRDIDHALVGADSREAVARAVADRLAADDPYRAVTVAWREGARLVPDAWGGRERDGAARAFPAATGPAATDPGTRALETGAAQVVRDVGADGGLARDVGDETDPWRRSAHTLGARAVAVVPVRHEDRRLGVIAVYAGRRDDFESRELAVLDGFGETVGHAVVALERRERVTALADLHRLTRELFHAETTDAVGEVAVAAGPNLLGVDVALLAYDAADHRLRIVASSGEDATALADGTDRASVVWRAFASGESRTVDDLREAEGVAAPSADARSAAVVPLADHGVLAAVSETTGAFDERRRQLVDLLAATTEAALDRLASEADRRAREADLRERNERLVRLQRLNDVIRDVDQAMVGATSRAEIETAVCERLTADDRFAFAWIAGVDDRDPVEPRAAAGGGTYLENVSFDRDASPPEPALATLATGEPTVVDSLADRDRSADWVSAGLDAGFAAAVAVPLSLHDIDYGALAVYADRPETFDERTVAVFADLADTVAYGINARETKRGLLAAGGTELKLAVGDGESVLTELAAAVTGPLRVVETRPLDGDATEITFVAPDASLSALRERSERSPVETVETVSDRGDEHVFRATVTGPVLPAELVEFGAVPRDIESTETETTAVVLLLPHVDARQFVERLRERYPSVELLARRERDSRSLTRGAFLDEFESLVTDRQFEVLRTAYERGYFDRPRASSGQEVADSLGVSQPTVNYHLRESQHRLLSLLFGDADDGSAGEPPDDEAA
ncbi:putative DNA binding protein [Halosimplex carlsbadense 2-9-1]|uniref:Putative DNA binding protein n=1 Tax=Halosimplex carlsbadense 2-9-1 TaxID=797114 RepID=M0D4S6_9EURY|nr:GAF domain-containing protein [Halosimplex carlsbadense]ELZ29692.1 putative DNA binding protein [Halosimplex carlsbadense 2-9-1]